jgi:hypothetical protein
MNCIRLLTRFNHLLYKKIVEYFAAFKPNNLLFMKKVLFVLVLITAGLVVNAQITNTTDSTRTTVKVADLQKAITDNIAKDFVGYTIKGATSVTENNVVTYEVVIVKGTTTETLVYDKEGLFVKKLLPTPKKE